MAARRVAAAKEEAALSANGQLLRPAWTAISPALGFGRDAGLQATMECSVVGVWAVCGHSTVCAACGARACDVGGSPLPCASRRRAGASVRSCVSTASSRRPTRQPTTPPPHSRERAGDAFFCGGEWGGGGNLRVGGFRSDFWSDFHAMNSNRSLNS